MSSQLSLLPETVLNGTPAMLSLNLFPNHFPGRVMDADMVESISKFGILQPILVIRRGDGYIIADGRSRIINSRVANREDVPALIFPEGYASVEVLTIVANARRSENFVTDVLAIQELMKADKEITLKDICNATQLSPKTAKKRMKLLKLMPELLTLLKENNISQTIAERIAGLNELQQKALHDIYLEKGRLTDADVTAITSAGATQAAMELDEDLFEDKEGQAMQLLRDLLKAARLSQARIPADLHRRMMELVGDEEEEHDF